MKFRRFTATAALVALSSLAQAELFDRGNGTVYDSTQNITWLQDWNVNGPQNLATQNAWADNLSFAGGSAWALPSNSQFTHLFAEFGDLRSASLPFTNVQTFGYWTSTVWPFGGDNAWRFRPDDGDLNGSGIGINNLQDAVVVHPGDVSAVPEPQTYGMALLGLVVVLVAVRRRPR